MGKAAKGRWRGFTWRELRKRYRQGYVRLLKSPGAPREVAAGMAVGLFVALMPIPMQMAAAVLVAEVLRRLAGLRVSRVAAAAAVWVTNPLTAIPIYALTLFVGRPFARRLLPHSEHSPATEELVVPVTETGEAVVDASAPFALEIGLALVIGGTLIGIPLALVGYRLGIALVTRYQHRRALRRARLERLRPPIVAESR